MKRAISYFTAAFITFGLGVLVWSANPLRWIEHEPSEPLHLRLSHGTDRDGHPLIMVSVQNMTRKTVRGYSLGFTCDCLSEQDPNRPYPHGISFTNPIPDREILKPGETQTMPLVPLEIARFYGSQPLVWVDLVHFEQGANWGPNQSHTEGYVRE